ncbi:amino acid adenylation domain-containing protein [Streptomyces sp. XM4193]|uniref:non-ribosomal peptide synthetase n=1 Tax=Streptomyces sp. XM4193 TaxID=2929782 RepID=UPI001FF813C8|nr:non-ribosomal peptide synthetase [Streptomyces sp. XM4193]MCK1795095.1 amino acid adenylation domain-containing protein [Streptomyces sp. XM4193]
MSDSSATVLPLTAGQAGIWYAHSLSGPNATFHAALYLEIPGAVDPQLFSEAMRQIVTETEVLRARFSDDGSGPVQTIEPVTDWSEQPLHVLDLRDEDSPREHAEKWMWADADTPLDVLEGPLYRFALMRVADDLTLFYYRFHHLVMDAFGANLVAARLAEVYTGLVEGTDTSAGAFPPLRALVEDEEAYRESASFAADRDFWAEQFADKPVVASLGSRPTALPRHLLRGSKHVSAATGADVRGAARAVGVGWPAAMLAALGVYTSRITGSTDVVLALSVAARDTTVARAVPGMVSNVIGVRLKVRPEMTAAELIAHAHQRMRAATRHKRYRYEDIRRDLKLLGADGRLLGPRANLHVVAPPVTFAGVPASLHPMTAGHDDDFSLVMVAEEDGSFRLDMSANPDAYSTEDADLHHRLVTRLMGELAARPDRPVGALDMVEPELLDRFAVEWRGATAKAEAGERSTLTARFAAAVAAHPDNTAVLCPDGSDRQSLTYRELDARSNQLARLLIERGVRRGQIVALALPRTVELAVAVLATLKTGAAYLPIDPEYPEERVSYVLGDAEPVAVVTAEKGDLAHADASIPRIALGDPVTASDLSVLSPSPIEDADRGGPVVPDQAAYVIYTSGSTGRPKGVVVAHQNVIRLFDTTAHWSDFGPDDVWSLFHSYAFDFSVWEIWGALLHGAKLVVVPFSVSRAPEEFLRLLVHERVTVLNQTPSAFAQLIQADQEHPELGDELALRFVVFGGEALEFGRLVPWYERHAEDAPRLVNMYGITETTVHSTELMLDAAQVAAESGSMIGVALNDLRVYILDSAMRPSPPGVLGEIYVSGPGVADGYFGRPDLTCTRFVADPFGPPGQRMYRSGDLARWTHDTTNMEYLGRVDHQVKIRGFRIELAEIDSAVLRHPDVQHTACVVREDTPGDKRLVAYVVAGSEGAEAGTAVLDTGELRKHAAAALPEHMVPSWFVQIDALPLTLNGKLDTRALPAPDVAAGGTGRLPRTPDEEIFCGLFAEILGAPSVSMDDNFFDLGGHSLLATKLVSRIRASFGVEVPIRKVFELRTPAAMLSWMAGSGNVPRARKSLTPMEKPEEIPLSFAQLRLWFIDKIDGGSGTYNIPLVVRLNGPLDRGALQEAIGDVVGRHESLRTVFPDRDGTPRQRILSAAEATPVMGSSEVSREELAAAMAERAGIGFDLATEAPIRAHLFVLPDDEHALLMPVHHIAGDGWSLVPLTRDLQTAYTARCRGSLPDWEPLPVQYADYTLWQREILGDEEDPDSAISGQLAHWQQYLAGLPEEVTLPSDRPRPAVASYRGETLRFELPPALHAQLMRCSREYDVSPFMVVQTALAALLSKLGAGEDVPLGISIAGRTDEALDDLVGFLVNTLVLRTDLSGDPRFDDLLGKARTDGLAAFANQDLPFERLVEAVNPERSAGRHPLIQIGLGFQNNETPVLDLPGLDAWIEPADTHTAKLDLLFDFREVQGEEPDEESGSAGTPDHMACAVEYATDLYDRSTVELLISRLVRLLDQATGQPGRRLSELDVLDADERRRLLVEWNDTESETHLGTLPELFTAQVERTPQATAVVAGDEELTYAELSARVNRLARELVVRGIGAEDRVLLVIPKSVDLVVAQLAVVTAGAAFVPVDPGYPRDRVTFMARDARPAMLLTCTEVADLAVEVLPELPRLVIDSETGSARIARRRSEPLIDADRREPTSIAHAAYVIYTSGSTGRPKGVVVTHRGIGNLASAQIERFAIEPDSRVVQYAAPSFDAAISETSITLLRGATLILPVGEGLLLGEALARFLTERRVTHATIPPVALTGLDPAAVPAGLTLTVAGEACSADLVGTWSQGRRMINAYGPTETTVCATMSQPLSGAVTPPIGTPIANAQVYVLDSRLSPVPCGVVGELYVSGVNLARGYLGRSGLTSERFVANPFGEPGARMYRTGDVVRWRADGQLDFVGRADDQVKLRGFRVELDEITSVLNEQAQVASAAVVIREDRPGDRRLVGYVVPTEGGEASRDVSLETDQVDKWQVINDEVYGAASVEDGPPLGENFAGWHSSYDSSVLPDEEMRAWRAATVERILELRPRRVLEIGVGAGLIMAPVAPHVDLYWGTDLSGTVIETLRSQTRQDPVLAERTRFTACPAHVLEGLPTGTFDTVVVNSVAQYFPSVEYLVDVIGKAFTLLGESGSVFLGDIRDLRLLHCMRAAIHRLANPGDGAAALRFGTERAVERETELLVDPGLFESLAEKLDGFGGVDIRTKRGSYENELNRYRYDVVVHKRPTAPVSLASAPTVEWDEVGGLAPVAARLRAERPSVLRVTGLPNARLTSDLAAVAEIEGPGFEVRQGPSQAEIDEMSLATGYRSLVTWNGEATDGRLDVVFVAVHDSSDELPAYRDLYLPGPAPERWANDPLAARKEGELVTELREALAKNLPDYMVPSALVLMEALPITPNGKLDQKALPAPSASAATSELQPSTPDESIIARLFAEVLGLGRVGADDDFFRQGGDSIISIQLVSKARAEGLQFTAQDVFAHRTVRALAAAATRVDANAGESADKDLSEWDIPLVSQDELDQFESNWSA